MRKGAYPPHTLRAFDSEFGLRSHTKPGHLESAALDRGEKLAVV